MVRRGNIQTNGFNWIIAKAPLHFREFADFGKKLFKKLALGRMVAFVTDDKIEVIEREEVRKRNVSVKYIQTLERLKRH